MRMRSMSVWTRLVLVIYLAAVVVVCLYVPVHASEPVLIHKPPTGVTVLSGPTMASFGHRWIWDLTETYSVVMGGDLYYYRTEASVDYRLIVLELVGLTAGAGVLLLVGSLFGGRER